MGRVAKRASLLGAEAAFFVLAKARELEAKGRNIVHLEIGEPDFDTPEPIKKVAMEALVKGETHYTPTPGIRDVRDAVAENVKRERGIDVDSEQVLITTGAKEAIFATIMTVVEEGDEVIYPNPGYPAYQSVASYAGAKCVPVRLNEENGFRMRPEDVNELVTDKTKMIVINSPENPCGSVLTKEDVKGISEIADDKGVYVLSDEIYKHIVYEGNSHYSPLQFVKDGSNVILVDGLSKSFAMTGWRIGYAVVPIDIAPPCIRLLNNIRSCPNSFVQRAAIAALRGPNESVEEMVRVYSKRREVVIDELERVEGISFQKPGGTFYVWINASSVMSKANMDSERFVEYLMEKYGVAVLHGSAMGSFGEGYIRISFANSIENLKKGIGIIREAFSNILNGKL